MIKSEEERLAALAAFAEEERLHSCSTCKVGGVCEKKQSIVRIKSYTNLLGVTQHLFDLVGSDCSSYIYEFNRNVTCPQNVSGEVLDRIRNEISGKDYPND